MSLALRFSVLIICLLSLFATALSVIHFVQFRHTSEEIRRESLEAAESEMFSQVRKEGEALAQTLASSLSDHVYYFNMEYIGDIASSARNQYNVSYVYVHDPQGRIIHDGTEYMESYGQVLADAYLEQILKGRKIAVWTGTMTDSSVEPAITIPVVNIAAPIKIGDRTIGGVRLGLSLREFYKDIAVAKFRLSEISETRTNRLLTLTLTVTVLLILLGIAFSILLARWLSRPISDLARITTEIGRGKFRTEIPDLGNDEIGNLAASIKKMAMQRQQAEADLMRSEARLKHLLSSGQALIYAKKIDQDETATFISSNVVKQLGYSVEDVMAGPEFWLFHIHPDDRKKYISFLAGLSVGESRVSEYRFRRFDGDYRLLRDEFIYNKGTDGGAPEIIGTLVDVTEQRMAEADLRRHQKAESIGNMTSGIAHNLNNLLQPILALSYLAKLDYPKDSPEYENMEVIELAGTRAAELVSRIMMFSREGNSFRESLDVHEVVQETLELLGPTFPSTLEVVENLDPDTGCAFIDNVQFQTAILNIASNAVHAMRGRPGRLTFDLSREQMNEPGIGILRTLDPGIYAKLSIADTGTGMDPETLSKIFDPFFTTKEVGEGTGLGLASAYGNIRSMKGTINAYSEPGRGTRFEILVPLAEDTQAQESVSAAD